MMARQKVSLSSLLDGDQPEPSTPPDAPKALVVAPAPPVDAVPLSAAGPVESELPADPAGEALGEASPVPDPDPEVVDAAPVAARPAVRAIEPKPGKPRSGGTVRSIKAAPEPPPLPLYLELTRKEARFRQDQLNDLTALTRQLNRRRASTGERITDNTLIRVAVDMLLKVADALDGATETELLEAVSAKLKR